MATFKLARIVPVIERLTGELSSRHGYAARDAIVRALLADEAGRRLVERAKSKNTKSWTERQIAGNMVDWFSANFAIGAQLTQSARTRFDRAKYRGKWAYYPLGATPTFATDTATEADDAASSRPRVPSTQRTGFSLPRAFVSYSHDSELHKEWVGKLAIHLRANGVDVAFDQWDLIPGDDAPRYMERAVRDSDWVVVVCTEKYIDKANNGTGGAGYEKMIMTAELVRSQTKRKFIPVVRTTRFPPVPTFLEGTIYIDFTDDSTYSDGVDSLLRTIHSAPRSVKPPIGPNPYGPGGSGIPRIV